MINIKEIRKAKDLGISIENYILLRIIEDGSLYLFPEVKDFTELYVLGLVFPDTTNITPKGFKILSEISAKDKIDYTSLHRNLQECLKKWTGKKQVQGFGGVYFLPTIKELEEFLNRFWKNYPKFTDIVKIEKILLKHITKCAKENKFSPATKYFIHKQGSGSQLANAYENWEEEEITSSEENKNKGTVSI